MAILIDQYRHHNSPLMATAIVISVVAHGLLLYFIGNQRSHSSTEPARGERRIELSFVNTSSLHPSPNTATGETEQPETHQQHNKLNPTDTAQPIVNQPPDSDPAVVGKNEIGIDTAARGLKTQLLPATQATTGKQSQDRPSGRKQKFTLTRNNSNISVRVHNKPEITATSNESNDIHRNHQPGNTVATTEATTTQPRQRLLREVNDELRKHLEYPFMARKRGWSGMVTISFQFTDRGTIHNIHLSSSSGYPLLDNSALNAFHSIMNIKFTNQSDTASSATLQLPVEYRLTEG
ncbi:MAG: energy transducer TonB [Gammaproteobacteria bacterium]|jgi:TonB family protein